MYTRSDSGVHVRGALGKLARDEADRTELDESLLELCRGKGLLLGRDGRGDGEELANDGGGVAWEKKRDDLAGERLLGGLLEVEESRLGRKEGLRAVN